MPRRFRESLFTALGTAMAVGLFWAAGQPGVGDSLRGAWHYLAHFATFAVFGAVWRLGLPGIPAPAIAAGVAAFGFVHEAYEMLGHGHGFELADAIVDSLGGALAAFALRLKAAARP